MGKITQQSNWRVEVEPRQYSHTTATVLQERCESIAEQIRRHVDDFRSVEVVCDNEAVCCYCGSKWTERGVDYNGGCCSKDILDQEAREQNSDPVQP